MTRLPTEAWGITPRPDLPEYDLNEKCASPYWDDFGGYRIENHHLWRKSLDPGLKDAWWVELPDGEIVPNRIGLSLPAHQMITENKARIVLDKGVFYWVDKDGTTPLDPQPGPPTSDTGPQSHSLGRIPVGGAEGVPVSLGLQQTIDGDEVPHETVCRPKERPCSRCKGKGTVPNPPEAPEKPSDAPARPKVTWSVRVPKDERENGYEVLTHLLEAATEKAQELGLIQDVNKGAAYYVLTAALHQFCTS